MTAKDMESAAPIAFIKTPYKKGQYLFNPVVDFFFLGGASLVVLPIMLFYFPYYSIQGLLSLVLFLDYSINSSHFFSSYFIFYRNFGKKIFNQELSWQLRLRYLLAGVVVPICLVVFFILALMQPNNRMIGYGVNCTSFFVGWHYVKQGYGMLIVDSVFKKHFFGNVEKRLLLYNTYACWLFYWTLANTISVKTYLIGIPFQGFHISRIVLYLIGAIAITTTLTTIGMLAKKYFFNKQSLPVIGVTVYLITLYIWLFGTIDPVLTLLIPYFHGLQYLIVVSRFEMNRAKASTSLINGSPRRVAANFIMLTILTGLAATTIPNILDLTIGFHREIFGSTVFLFMFWIFVNIQHYFMDNAIWRGDNPEARAYLFQGSSR